MAEETVIRVLNQKLRDNIQAVKKSKPWKLNRVFWVLSWAMLLVIIMTSLSTPFLRDFDKQLHFFGYMLLAALFTFSQRGILIPISMCSLLLMSALLELIQALLGRTPEWHDLIINGYGIVVGLVLAFFAKFMNRYFRLEKSHILAKKRSCLFKQGEKIFSQGDRAKYLYVVLSGEISIYRKEDKQKKTIDMVQPGEVFGEMGLILDDVRYASARASVDSILFVMSKHELFFVREREQHPSILVVQTLARRLQYANEMAALQKKKLQKELAKKKQQ